MINWGFYQENNEKNRIQILAGWVVDILAVIALAVFLVTGMGNPHTIAGHSMEPTLNAGDVVLVNAISYHIFDVKRFDLVQFTIEEPEEKVQVKRIIGLPGETVQILEGKIYINGAELEHSKDMADDISISGLAEQEIQLGKNEYFLLGDNNNSSEDSRFANIGNVNRKQIQGKVWARVSPLDSIGFLR